MRVRFGKLTAAANCARLSGDRQFHWAVAAALPVWLIGYWWLMPEPDWRWPLRVPDELLLLGLLYPLAEEVLFRGLLQGWLLERGFARRRVGITGANWLTSGLFTGLHFIAHPPLAAASVLLPSLVFGHFRDRHGGLCAPIVLHVYYNVGYFWLFAS